MPVEHDPQPPTAMAGQQTMRIAPDEGTGVSSCIARRPCTSPHHEAPHRTRLRRRLRRGRDARRGHQAGMARATSFKSAAKA